MQQDTSPDVTELWVSTAEAARLLGISQATALRRVRRGTLRGDLVARPQGTEWRICVPVSAIVTRPDASAEGEATMPPEPEPPPPQASELERFAALLDVHMRGYVEREAERDRQLAVRMELIGELRTRVALAEQAASDREDLAQQLAIFREAVSRLQGEIESLRARPGWWARLLTRLRPSD